MDSHAFQQYVDEAKMIRHCAPVFFLPSLDSKATEIAANGTIALVYTGTCYVLVTCYHVLGGFYEYRSENRGGCFCTVFDGHVRRPIALDPDSPIDADASLDLAVFPAYPRLWPMGNKEFYQVNRWPIPKAKVGAPIAFLGFPGAARVVNDEVGNFQYSSFGLTITEVSDRKFVVAGNGPGRGKLRDNSGNVVPPMALGGMSGSPAYVRDVNAGFGLAGFVQMGNRSCDDLFFTHACALNRDGTIQK